MAFQLVVIHPFAEFEPGQHITDPAEVEKWGASHPAHVVRKVLDEPEPAPKPVSAPVAAPAIPAAS